MSDVFISLPYPPTVNTYWRTVMMKGVPRTLISKGGREYAKAVAWCVLEQRIKNISGDLEVSVMLYPPDLRERDVDNTAKALLDALAKAGVMDNDSQVKRLILEMRDKCPPGRADVTIKKYVRGS